MTLKGANNSCLNRFAFSRLRKKNGSLLILVLIIMAVAMILITSALMISVSARNHYYQNAEEQQTALTALSVARTIAGAVTSAEITDDELTDLADNSVKVDVTSASGFTSAALAANNNSIAPGLADQTDVAQTTATFGYYPSKSDPQYISVIVKTTLNVGTSDGTDDTVTLLLKEKEAAISLDAFANQVTLGGAGVTNNFMMFGMGYKQWEDMDNYLIFHGDVTIYQSGASNPHAEDRGFKTDVVVTDLLTLGYSNGDSKYNYELYFQGNLVLAGDNATINDNSKNKITVDKNLIALGYDGTIPSMITDQNGVDSPLNVIGTSENFFVNGCVYLSNRKLTDNSSVANLSRIRLPAAATSRFIIDDASVLTTNFTPSNSSQYYLAASTGTLNLNGTPITAVTSDSVITAVQSVADFYGTQDIAAHYNRQVLTSAEAMDSGMTEFTTQAEVLDSANGVVQLTNTQLSGSGNTTTLTGPSYRVSTSQKLGNISNSWSGAPTNVVFDLASNDITLYITGNGTFKIGSGRFEFINGGAHIGRIVLLEGANLEIQENRYFATGESKVYETGILGTSRSAAIWSAWPDTVFGYKPYVYIFGMNNNTVTGLGRSTLEAYIGLYGTNGTLALDYYCYFFGRVESMQLNSVDDSNGIDFPYCPGPNDLAVYMRQIVRSSYEVEGYVSGT